jgi:hypothetical protein
MGLPLLLANYGNFRGQMYGQVLVSYPRSIDLKDVGDVDQLLAEENKVFNSAKVFEWISENAGPLPAELMPDRVAEAVNTLIVS